MVDLAQIKNISFNCPYCQNKLNQFSELLFTGIHVLWDVNCGKCSRNYYVTLPLGHASVFQVIINKNTDHHIFPSECKHWLAIPLIKALKENNQVDLIVKKRILKSSKNIIILNCLDNCFGHVFWKLLNAQRHLNQHGLGLVLIIPEAFSWLIPEGVVEVWSIDAPLTQLDKYIKDFDAFIKDEIKRFDSARLSKAFPHIDHGNIDLEKFLKTKKFDLDDYTKKPTTITYLLREDRFWLNHNHDKFLYLLCLKFGMLHVLDFYFIKKQINLINKTADLIRKKVPDAVQIAVGIGSKGKLKKFIRDYRTSKMNIDTEKRWCEIYSNSHVVLGVHGSNMIIPTGLAAGFVEILPDYKIPHITEDITFDANSRFTLFLGRHLANGVSPKVVFKHLIGMIERFPYLKFKTELGRDH